MTRRYILTLSCNDAHGIVAAVSGFLAAHDGFIIESAQFGDASTGRFFLRMEFEAGHQTPAEDVLKKMFHDAVGKPFEMHWQMHDKSQKSRVLVMVSRYGHCLNDVLHRYSTGLLPIEIPAVVSNHTDFKEAVEWHKIPFYHLPVNEKNKSDQEASLKAIIRRHVVDVVVLARYMQILSAELSSELAGKAINIHHSFLPSFKGARPYHQAFDRGVKLIGATAHYITDDLDEGPIIEQEIARVDHSFQPEDLAAVGRDTECAALARALKYHIEHRVLLNGRKTVVFK